MITKFLRMTALLGGVLLVSMSMVGQSAWAARPGPAPPGDHLDITEVLVDFGTDTITITGEHLDHGPGPLVVTLGDANNIGDITDDCTPDFASDPQTIVCDLSSSSGLPPDGDYQLTVSRGAGQSQNDAYDLTIAGGDDNSGGPQPCPDGFVEVNADYCIEADQQSGATWVDANSDCITADARLCTAGEWIYACLNAGALSLNDLPPADLEWLGDFASGPNANRLGESASGDSCTAGSSGSISSGEEEYRCCFSR